MARIFNTATCGTATTTAAIGCTNASYGKWAQRQREQILVDEIERLRDEVRMTVTTKDVVKTCEYCGLKQEAGTTHVCRGCGAAL